MKKHIKVSILLLTAGAAVYASDNDHALGTSKTFFSIRPPFRTANPEKEALWRDRALARECGWSGAFQIVPFGGRSTQPKDIARYFTFCNKDCLIVAEDLAPGSNNTFTAPAQLTQGAGDPNFRDVNAIHFNIQTTGRNFKSQICFRPRHSYAGVGLDYKQYLHRRDACEKKWWLEISTPLLWVKNDMRLTETILNNPTGTFLDGSNTSMTEAFCSNKGLVRQAGTSGTASILTGSVMQFGRICGSKDKFRAADIEVKIGYDYLCEDLCHADGYIGGVIPTGNKTKGVFVFEPIVGNEFHGGIMWGGDFGWEIWSNCDRYLHVEMATNGRYLFRNTQTRSFDVKFKPWSRYMAVYPKLSDALSTAPQEGINFFTRKVRVSPRFIKDINAALVYTSCGFQGEVGWNFWAKSSEKIKLRDDFPTTITFAAVQQGGGFLAANINRAITIKENFEGCAISLPDVAPAASQATAYNLQAIKEADLDLQTAAATCALTNTIYGSLGYRWDNWCYPVFVGVGGSYEQSSEKGAISAWMIWGKFGVSI